MTHTQYERIGLSFQEARESANKTQEDIAQFLKCTKQTVSRWERGSQKIGSASLMKCLLWFGTNIYRFIEECGYEEMSGYEDGDPEAEKDLLRAYRALDPEGRKKLLEAACVPVSDRPRPVSRRRK